MDLVAVARGLADRLPVSELSDEQLAEILSRARLRRFGRDEVIYHHGDPSVHLHVVVEGSVKLIREEESGREVLLWIVERGGIFGQQGVFGTARPATAVAVTETTTLQLVGEVVRHVLEREPRIMFRAIEMIEARVNKLTETLEDVMLLDVPSRIAKYLLDPTRHGGAANVPLTQEDLAAAVGTTRVTVNKVLADLERRGLVRVSRLRVEVLAPELLAKEVGA